MRGRVCIHTLTRYAGEGAFGIVSKLQLIDPAHQGIVVALKTVLQDPKYKVGWLINHCN